jgi:hypothetical protein
LTETTVEVRGIYKRIMVTYTNWNCGDSCCGDAWEGDTTRSAVVWWLGEEGMNVKDLTHSIKHDVRGLVEICK